MTPEEKTLSVIVASIKETMNFDKVTILVADGERATHVTSIPEKKDQALFLASCLDSMIAEVQSACACPDCTIGRN